MLRRTLALLGFLALAFTILATSGNAFAATPPNPSSIDIAALSKTCAIISIHMDGAQSTVSCRRARATHGIVPLLGRDNSCNNNDVFVIKNYSSSGTLCFNGSGYLGVAIYQVNSVKDTGTAGAWFRWYQGAGHYQSLSGGQQYNFGSGTTNVEVTQLCYGNTNYPNC